MEQDEEETIEWLRVLGLPDNEFRMAIRPYFDTTGAMDAYIEVRPRQVEEVNLPFSHAGIPTKPAPVLEEPVKPGHYKGKRRKR